VRSRLSDCHPSLRPPIALQVRTLQSGAFCLTNGLSTLALWCDYHVVNWYEKSETKRVATRAAEIGVVKSTRYECQPFGYLLALIAGGAAFPYLHLSDVVRLIIHIMLAR